MAEDRAAIEAAVQTYLDGLYEGDVAKLGSVFHETSALTWEESGAIKVLPRAEWLAAVSNRSSPKTQGLPRHDEIVSIDQSSPGSAFVKLRCAIPPRFFTDYLSLLKIDGRWQVAQKVFATRIEASGA
ncbi:nuclear transport factor 2 family protein [uncultured Enterovirga sp.]|uniref:nuclear transport factor 2 family protein n=1 Tax=uncultured Enterovirga sp. TaxID=2026352 RepID=UPI0035CC29B8